MKNFFSIIGGMGTVATESYLRLINSRLEIHSDQDYLDYILVNHATVPDRTSYILDHNQPSFYPYLVEDIEQQNLLNPKFMVIVCNTAHYFYEELKEHAKAPLLNMPHIAVKKLAADFPNEKKIGLIATRGTIADEIYKHEIEAVGKTVELGGPEIQPMVDELIYGNIKEHGRVDESLYYEILKKMHDDYGCNVIVLGCTELSLSQELAPNHSYNVIDAQSIIADVSIELAIAARNDEPKFQHLIKKYLA